MKALLVWISLAIQIKIIPICFKTMFKKREFRQCMTKLRLTRTQDVSEVSRSSKLNNEEIVEDEGWYRSIKVQASSWYVRCIAKWRWDRDRRDKRRTGWTTQSQTDGWRDVQLSFAVYSVSLCMSVLPAVLDVCLSITLSLSLSYLLLFSRCCPTVTFQRQLSSTATSSPCEWKKIFQTQQR